MRRNGVKGNVYNPLWWGSYITWEPYPAVKVSMDGRNVSLFPDEMVGENSAFTHLTHAEYVSTRR